MVRNPATNKVYGPFWGEFGWEIAQWAPYVNAMAGDTDRIMCMPGHAPLYASDVPISQSSPRPSGGVPDMMGCSGEHKLIGILGQVHPERLHLTTKKGVPCLDVARLAFKPIPIAPHLENKIRLHVVIHCRNIPKCPERNMDGAKWAALVDMLQKVGVTPVAIGSKDDHLPMGCHDARDLTLNETTDWLREAKVVVGASSGPMHLAQACEAPVVVWSGNAKKDKPRYEDVWNHFDSPTTFVSPSWSPGVGKIMKAIEKHL